MNQEGSTARTETRASTPIDTDELRWNRRGRETGIEVCKLAHSHLTDDCVWEGLPPTYNAGTLVRAALSDHDTTLPLSSHELRNLAIEIENDLVNSESNFSDGWWRYVDGLFALAATLEAK